MSKIQDELTFFRRMAEPRWGAVYYRNGSAHVVPTWVAIEDAESYILRAPALWMSGVLPVGQVGNWVTWECVCVATLTTLPQDRGTPGRAALEEWSQIDYTESGESRVHRLVDAPPSFQRAQPSRWGAAAGGVYLQYWKGSASLTIRLPKDDD